jgi:hypothetical protein
MDNVFSRQTELMDRSGLGLLPGIALAFVIALFMIAAITLHTWWAVGIGLAGSIGGGASPAPDTVATIAAHVAITQRFNIRSPPGLTIAAAH